MSLANLGQFLLDHGLVASTILLLIIVIAWLIRVVMDPDRADLLRAKAYRALLAISGKRDHEKKYLANDLRGRLNLARRKVHFGRHAVPHAVDIEWVSSSDQSTYDVADGEFVIRLDPAHCQSSNIVRMTSALVQRTALVGIRHLLPDGLRDALYLPLTHKLLKAIGNRPAVDVFHKHHYPNIAASPDFTFWNKHVSEIDDQGLYERLLLVELEDFARRILGMHPRPYMIGEVENLVKFVHRLATRQVGEEIPLDYYRAHIRVGVVLVAKAKTILEQGIEPYLKAARIHLEERKVDALYLIAWEKPHLRQWPTGLEYKQKCNNLQKQLRSRFQLEEHFRSQYDYVAPNGRRRTGFVTRYFPTDR